MVRVHGDCSSPPSEESTVTANAGALKHRAFHTQGCAAPSSDDMERLAMPGSAKRGGLI
jgi:hypothetical protein